MNKTFKVVWSKARNAYVVVSELAKNSTKGCSAKKLLAMLIATGVMTVVGVHGAEAASVAIGSNKDITDVSSGVAVSDGTTINGTDVIAIGSSSNASGDYTISLGVGATTSGLYGETSTESTAIGHGARAYGTSTIAFGTGASTAGLYGEKSTNSTAIGQNARAYGTSTIAFGTGASTAGKNNINSNDATAIGTGAIALGTSVVAIGTGATASNGYNGATTNAVAIGTNSAASSNDSIAVGTTATSSNTRSIAIGSSFSEEVTEWGNTYTKTTKTVASGIDSIAVGTGAEAFGENSIAEGKGASVGRKNSIAIGNGATISNANYNETGDSVAIGTGANVQGVGIALGTGATVSSSVVGGQDGIAIGNGANAAGQKAIAIGYGATATNSTGADKSSIAIGNGATSDGETNVVIGNNAKMNSTNSDNIVVGNGANLTGSKSIVMGTGAYSTTNQNDQIILGSGANTTGTAQYSTVIGSAATASREYSVVLGSNSNSTTDNGVALGSYSVSNRQNGGNGVTDVTKNPYLVGDSRVDATIGTTGAISVGGGTLANGQTALRQIMNVAAGSADSDAVNVAQLRAVAAKISDASGMSSFNVSTNKDYDNATAISDGNTVNFSDGLNTTVTKEDIKDSSDNVIGTSIKVNAIDTKVAKAAGDEYVTVTGGDNLGTDNVRNYTVGLTQKAIEDFTKDTVTTVAAGTKNVIVSDEGKDGNHAYKVSAATVSKAENSAITVTTTTDANGNITDYVIGVDAANEAFHDKFNVTANGNAVKTIGNNDTLNFVNGDNVSITNDSGSVKISATNNYVTAATLSGNTLTLTRNGDLADLTVDLSSLSPSTGDSVHYYSVKSSETGTDSNYNNDGAKGNNALAAGVGAVAQGDSSIAIGNNASTTPTKSDASGQFNIAIGYNAKADGERGAIAIGMTNTAASGISSVAIGDNAIAKENYSVAVGNNSVAERTSFTTAYLSNEDVSAAKEFAVGSGSVKRQITNVAGGTADTDAVNVAQLKAAKVQVVKGKNVTVDEETLDTTYGGVKYTVNAWDTTVSSGNKYIKVTPTINDTDMTRAYAVSLDIESLKADVDTNTVTSLTVNGGTEAPDTTGTHTTTGNLLISQTNDASGNPTYDVKLNNSVTLGDSTESGSLAVVSKDGNSTIVANENGLGVKQGDTNFAVNNSGVGANIGDTNLSVTKDGVGLSKGDSQMVVNEKGTSFSNGNNGTTNINGATVTSGKVVTDGNKGIISGLTNQTTDYDGFADGSGKAATEEQLKAVKAIASAHNTVVAGKNVTIDESTNEDGGIKYTINAKDTVTTATGDDYIKVENSATDGNYAYNISLDTTKIATKEDGLTFTGDSGTTTKKLNETLAINGDDKNITTAVEDGAVKVKLNNKLDLGSEGSVTMGDTTINNGGITTGGNTFSSTEVKVSNGTNVDMGGNQIHNVAAGEADTDAVNVGQLKDTNNAVNQNTQNINKLSHRVDKGLAGAAALAALHPLDFDPDDKLTFAAGIGNYKGENAGAVGMFYRPDEKVMFSLGATVGNDDNMVNAGVSFSLDRTARVTNTKTAMAKEIVDLRAKVVELTATVEKMGTRLGTIDEDKVTLFPDIDENHWAYEYVGKLAAAGIIEGYPDGNFGGDRMMSRYEFAAMLYRAMQNGAQLDGKIVKEFAPEMGRIRVDRISGEDNDKRKVERVRTNGDEKDAAGNVTQYRDHYGSKITSASK